MWAAPAALAALAAMALALPPAAAAQQPSVTIGDAAVVEGDSGMVDAAFTVYVFGVSAQPVTVDFATRDATATQPSDYAPRRGTLTFLPGETSKRVVVPVHGDTAVERDELFALDLSNASNAAISHAQGVGKILNDDLPETRRLIRLNGFLGLTRGYAAQLGLTCTSAAKGRCRGSVSLSLRGRRAAVAGEAPASRAARRRALGRRRFSIPAGRRARVAVRLSRRGRALLARRGRLRVDVHVAARDASGRRGTARRPVTIRAP